MKKRQAFTLVELIVVITILAILGTVAFLSFQGFNLEARNVKRTSDIQNIRSKVEVLTLQATPLSSFVLGSGSTLIWDTKIRIAGYEGYSALSGSYLAWNINPTALEIKQENFLDPIFGESYKIGYDAYSNTYEVAATIEKGGWEYDSFVDGSWDPRSSSDVSYSKVSHTWDTFYLSWATFPETDLQIWDVVRFTGDTNATYIITGYFWDRVTVDKTITHSGANVFLHGNETRSLIKRWDSDNAIDFGRWYQYTPYYN